MNFRNDLYKIAKQLLDHYGVKSSSAKTGRDFIEMYINMRLKLIHPQKYQVLCSETLTSRSLSSKINDGIDSVQKKLEQGDDVTPHMSEKILKGTFTDRLFSDWGIYHLHLGLSMEGNFIKRTKEVLFLVIKENRAYFIDVREHGISGEPYVFSQLDLLQTLADEFPEVMEPFEVKHVVDISLDITDPAEIDKCRKAGLSLPYKINDKIYDSMGGGITSASTSVRVVEETDRLLRWADDKEKCINKKRDKIDAVFSQKSINYEADKADFHLCIDGNRFLLLSDKYSGVSEQLYYF